MNSSFVKYSEDLNYLICWRILLKIFCKNGFKGWTDLSNSNEIMKEYGPREDHLPPWVLISTLSGKYFCLRNTDFSIFLRVCPSGHGRLFLCRPVRIIWIFRDELRLYIHIPTEAHFSDFRAHSPIRTHPDTGPHPRLCMVCIFGLVFVLILFSEKFLEIRLSSWMRVKWALSDFWQFCPSLEHMGFGLPFVNSKLWRFRGYFIKRKNVNSN